MPATESIQVVVNGQPATTRDAILIPEFLRESDICHDRVVVEWNGQAMTREESAAVRLADGDRLEVVRIVAGG
jgi:thiamine biosynthesis protein ThiS